MWETPVISGPNWEQRSVEKQGQGQGHPGPWRRTAFLPHGHLSLGAADGHPAPAPPGLSGPRDNEGGCPTNPRGLTQERLCKNAGNMSDLTVGRK